MKKLITTLLFLISASYLFSFSGGNGTEASPYEIANYDDMLELRDSVEYGIHTNLFNWSYEKYFKVTQDITTPIDFHIGRYSVNYTYAFSGYFLGQNYEITLNLTGEGLFGAIAYFTIQDVILKGNIITAEGIGNTLGSLCGIATNVLIKNCISYCNITRNSSPYLLAGLVGEARRSNIEDCIFAGTITSNSNIETIGGIVGLSGDNEIIKCLNLGNIIYSTSNSMFVCGGIVGYGSAIINNCIWAGSIILKKTNSTPIDGFGCGGIAGVLPMRYNASSIISNCVSTGVIVGTETDNIGAILGADMVQSLTITNCHYDKQFCIYKGVNGVDVPGVSGHITRYMVGRKLANLLGDTDWTYTEGATFIQSLYPQLKVFSESPDKRKSDASKVGATPIFLYDGIKD
ncbi:MAG: hypothetical protein FWG85_07930 [Bacteroidetes bacterium]|nr:hypothetical protein [Bacteroidota bacterium]